MGHDLEQQSSGPMFITACHQPSSLLRSRGMERPKSAGKTWRGSLEMISNCVTSVFSHSCCGLLACSSASKPTGLSPVVSIQAPKLFKLLAERCFQVSAPIVPEPHQWRCNPNNSMQKLHGSDKYLNDLIISHMIIFDNLSKNSTAILIQPLNGSKEATAKCNGKQLT